MEVTFHVALQVESKERVFLCGNSTEFGNWQLSNAFELSRTSEDIWTGTTRLKPGEYKFKCVRVAGLIMDWESGENRIMRIEKTQCPGSKMEVSMKFAETHSSETVRTVRETLVLDTDGNELYLVTGQVHKLTQIDPVSAISPKSELESESTESESEVCKQTPNKISIKKYFQSVLCFNKKDLSILSQKCPNLKSKSLDSEIKPLVKLFQSKLGVLPAQIGALIKTIPKVLERPIKEVLAPMLDYFLKDLEATPARLYEYLKGNPYWLKASSKEELKARVKSWKKITKLHKSEIGKILLQQKTLLRFSADKSRTRFEHLKTQLSLPTDQCSELILRCPVLLNMKPENISKKVTYYTEELDRSIEEIVNHPVSLCHSLEKKIKKRFQQLERVGIRQCMYPLYLPLAGPDEKFDDFIEKELNRNKESYEKTEHGDDDVDDFIHGP
eukprot:g7511.t1